MGGTVVELRFGVQWSFRTVGHLGPIREKQGEDLYAGDGGVNKES